MAGSLFAASAKPWQELAVFDSRHAPPCARANVRA
jgi:hypothetical protein